MYNDFLLTAFTKFDQYNRATLTMPEYIEFLINFWDRVNRVYAQRTVSVPVFGSGITRIKEHKKSADRFLSVRRFYLLIRLQGALPAAVRRPRRDPPLEACR